MDKNISYKPCAVKVRNAKLRNYLKVLMSQNFFLIFGRGQKLVNRFVNIFRFSLFIREIRGSKQRLS